MFTDILWDFDGTLFDTYPGFADALLRALSDEGIQADYAEVMELLRVSVSVAIEHYRERYRLGDPFLERFDLYHREWNRSGVRMFPHAAEIIQAVHASGRRSFLYTHRGYSAMEYLEEQGLIDCFQDCITHEDGFPPKPSPEAILYLIGKHNIVREQALMVGDREIDILAAQNAGIQGCFFHPDPTVVCGKADYTIRSLDALAPIIGIK
jgi:HAD superfamily hydrolase (TIGR01509 family)